MRDNVEKLLLMGFGIILAAFMIITNAHGQTSVNPDKGSPSIKSTEDYLKIEQMVDDLASQLYKINQRYPGFTFHHNFDADNELVSVTIKGISNKDLADKVARQIMVLEELGDAVKKMDMKLLPETPDLEENKLNEMDAAGYDPQFEIKKIGPSGGSTRFAR